MASVWSTIQNSFVDNCIYLSTIKYTRSYYQPVGLTPSTQAFAAASRPPPPWEMEWWCLTDWLTDLVLMVGWFCRHLHIVQIKTCSMLATQLPRCSTFPPPSSSSTSNLTSLPTFSFKAFLAYFSKLHFLLQSTASSDTSKAFQSGFRLFWIKFVKATFFGPNL